MAWVNRLGTASFFGCILACAQTNPARAPGPGEAIEAYARTLREGDADASWALERTSAHRRRDREGQRAGLADARAELGTLGERLAALPPSALRASARVPTSGGEIVLALEADGTWRVEGGTLGAPALVEPRDAVSALRRALVRRDLNGIEQVLARATREQLVREIERVVEQTADPDALSIQRTDERATLTTPDGTRVELLLEAGEWRVVDVRPAAPR